MPDKAEDDEESIISSESLEESIPAVDHSINSRQQQQQPAEGSSAELEKEPCASEEPVSIVDESVAKEEKKEEAQKESSSQQEKTTVQQTQTRSQRRKAALAEEEAQRKIVVRRDFWKLPLLKTFEYDLEIEPFSVFTLSDEYPEAFEQFEEPRPEPFRWKCIKYEEVKKATTSEPRDKKVSQLQDTAKPKKKRKRIQPTVVIDDDADDFVGPSDDALKKNATKRLKAPPKTTTTSSTQRLKKHVYLQKPKQLATTTKREPRKSDTPLLPFAGDSYEDIVFNEDDFLTYAELAEKNKKMGVVTVFLS